MENLNSGVSAVQPSISTNSGSFESASVAESTVEPLVQEVEGTDEMQEAIDVEEGPRFADEVRDLALDEGEDAALEMMAQEEPGEGELLADDDTDPEVTSEKEEALEQKHAEKDVDILKSRVDELEQLAKDISERVGKIEERPQFQYPDALQAQLERLNSMLSEQQEGEKKKDNKSLIQILLEVIIALTKFVFEQMTDGEEEMVVVDKKTADEAGILTNRNKVLGYRKSA